MTEEQGKLLFRLGCCMTVAGFMILGVIGCLVMIGGC
jgi:hypothetical protein